MSSLEVNADIIHCKKKYSSDRSSVGGGDSLEVSTLKASVSPTAFKTELKYLVKISLRDYTLILFEKNK